MYLDPIKYQGDMAWHETNHLFWKDIIRVKNPLDSDFRFKYDSIWTTVKANSTKDMERYLAVHFCRKMFQTIANQVIAEKGEKALTEMAKTQPNLLQDKYQESVQIWMKLPNLNNADLARKIYTDLWIGVVEKYGEDRDIPTVNRGKINPNTTLFEQIEEEFKNVRVGETPSPPSPTTASVVLERTAPPAVATPPVQSVQPVQPVASQPVTVNPSVTETVESIVTAPSSEEVSV